LAGYNARMARSRTRRVLKWTTTLACVLILGVWICSGWCLVRLGVVGGIIQTFAGGPRIPNQYESIKIGGGILSVTYVRLSLREEVAGRNTSEEDWLRELPPFYFESHDADAPYFRTWLPSFCAVGTCQRTIDVPCWIPFVLLAVPTALLWHRERRRIPPGHCQKCGYDLTGNVSGRCPECGTLVGSEKEAR
jgi:hypothetical protein